MNKKIKKYRGHFQAKKMSREKISGEKKAENLSVLLGLLLLYISTSLQAMATAPVSIAQSTDPQYFSDTHNLQLHKMYFYMA